MKQLKCRAVVVLENIRRVNDNDDVVVNVGVPLMPIIRITKVK